MLRTVHLRSSGSQFRFELRLYAVFFFQDRVNEWNPNIYFAGCVAGDASLEPILGLKLGGWLSSGRRSAERPHRIVPSRELL